MSAAPGEPATNEVLVCYLVAVTADLYRLDKLTPRPALRLVHSRGSDDAIRRKYPFKPRLGSLPTTGHLPRLARPFFEGRKRCA